MMLQPQQRLDGHPEVVTLDPFAAAHLLQSRVICFKRLALRRNRYLARRPVAGVVRIDHGRG